MNNQTLIVILIIVLLIAVYSPIVAKAFEKEEPETEPQYIQMEATAYCYGTTRCDGKKVRMGICAGKKEWYGKVAAVYEDAGGVPGNFIGFYECLDTGGEDIRSGKVLDIYNPDEDWCIRFGRKKVFVCLIDGEG